MGSSEVVASETSVVTSLLVANVIMHHSHAVPRLLSPSLFNYASPWLIGNLVGLIAKSANKSVSVKAKFYVFGTVDRTGWWQEQLLVYKEVKEVEGVAMYTCCCSSGFTHVCLMSLAL